MWIHWVFLLGCKEPGISCDELEETPGADLSVSVHPDMASILEAEWTQTCGANTWLEFFFDDVWHSAPARDLGLGQAEELALGIPFNREVSLRVAWEDTDGVQWGPEVDAKTGPAPDGAPRVESVEGDPLAWDPDTKWIFTSISNGMSGGPEGTFSLILDRRGRLVWARRTELDYVSLHVRPSSNGVDLLVDNNSFWAFSGERKTPQVVRMKIDTSIVEIHETPGLHHPYTDLPDGSIVYANKGEDGMDKLTRSTPDGAYISVWVCASYHQQLGEERNCSANTVWWNEADDTFLVSFYSTDSVVEIDPATGNVLRSFGNLADSWVFEPPESAFSWQHGVHFTEAGTFLVSTQGSGGIGVREYAVDEQREVLSEVWNFGLLDGVPGHVMGEAHRLGNGNTLHNSGSTPRLREATPEGEVVWDVIWASRGIGRSTPLSDLYAFAP